MHTTDACMYDGKILTQTIPPVLGMLCVSRNYQDHTQMLRQQLDSIWHVLWQSPVM